MIPSIFYHKQVRFILVQCLFALIVAYGIYQMITHLQTNLKMQGLSLSLGFLKETAGFSIIQHLIPFDEQSTYGQAFLVGLCNTLYVSALGIIISTVIGVLLGIWQQSKYIVEVIRNIPLLLQIFFWYFVVLRAAPFPKQSILLGDIVINNRGIYLPIGGTPFLENLNFSGGIILIPEFLALLIALSLYTSVFIAEIVRLGIASVPKGQKEAATALGLSKGQTLRLVVLPQALKVMLPMITNQYLNLVKNSSLAAAIAYPDLVSVFAGTVLNQTGHAVEIIGITMTVYLFINLVISAVMLWYEKHTNWGAK